MYKVIYPFTCGKEYSKNDTISDNELGFHIFGYLENGCVIKIVKEIKVEIPVEEPQSEEIQEEEINKTPLKVEIPETTSNPKNKK